MLSGGQDPDGVVVAEEWTAVGGLQQSQLPAPDQLQCMPGLQSAQRPCTGEAGSLMHVLHTPPDQLQLTALGDVSAVAGSTASS